MVEAPHWPPRPLTADERDVLELLLSAEFDGASQLRLQAETAMSVGGCACGCPSVSLLVADGSAPRASLPSRLAPVELEIAPDQNGIGGDVILFVDDGQLSYLEYVSYTDETPKEWPRPSQLSLRHGGPG